MLDSSLSSNISVTDVHFMNNLDCSSYSYFYYAALNV